MAGEEGTVTTPSIAAFSLALTLRVEKKVRRRPGSELKVGRSLVAREVEEMGYN